MSMNTKAFVALTSIIATIYDEFVEELNEVSKIKSYMEFVGERNKVSEKINTRFDELVKNRHDIIITTRHHEDEEGGNAILEHIHNMNYVGSSFGNNHGGETQDVSSVFQSFCFSVNRSNFIIK